VDGDTQQPTHPSTASPHVLIAEDDAPLANLLRRRLQSEAYDVHLAEDGEAAFELINHTRYHLLILDLNLPKLDGLSLLKRVRPKQPELSILVLTGRKQLEDRVLSLDCGADDCVLKPFSFSELLARVRALLRRRPQVAGGPLQVGDLTLDCKEFLVQRAGKKIQLSGKEFALLEYLMQNSRQTVTRAMIMEHVWNIPFDSSTNLVDVYVKYVRDKVDSQEFAAKLIRTVRGVGYVLSDN
jgi:two-component system, OmpR family, copper resistance phosphate regulon response regulator CusR